VGTHVKEVFVQPTQLGVGQRVAQGNVAVGIAFPGGAAQFTIRVGDETVNAGLPDLVFLALAVHRWLELDLGAGQAGEGLEGGVNRLPGLGDHLFHFL